MLNLRYYFQKYTQKYDESSRELVAEQFYNYIDKKLMQEQLNQEEYDQVSKKFNELAEFNYLWGGRT